MEKEEFSDVRSRLSSQKMAERLLAINQSLLGIRVYDFYGNVAASAGSPGNEGRPDALRAINERAGFTAMDNERKTETRYIFVDLRNPDAASDASVVVELRFSTQRLSAALWGLVLNYVIIGICAVLMGVLLAFALFRKLTGAIRAIVEDVGEAQGVTLPLRPGAWILPSLPSSRPVSTQPSGSPCLY